MTRDPLSSNSEDEDKRFILQRQHSRYQEIRNRTSRIFQLVISVASLIVSVGFLQLLTSSKAGVASLSIGSEVANRCSPDSLTLSGVSLRGLGPINYWLVGGILLLVCYLIIEIWWVNSKSQSLPPLKPHSEVEVHIFGYSDFIDQNSTQFNQAREYLFAAKTRLHYISALYGLSVFLLINLYFSRARILLVSDILIFTIGFLLSAHWIYRYIQNDEWSHFDWGSRDLTTPFILLFLAVLSFLLLNIHNLYLLINEFLIC